MEPQTLPGGEGLGGVFQHPEFVEQHYVKDDQQHQTGKETKGTKAIGMRWNLRMHATLKSLGSPPTPPEAAAVLDHWSPEAWQ